jgi:WD40 repeat protein
MLQEMTRIKIQSTCTSLAFNQNLLLMTSVDKKFRVFDLEVEKIVLEHEGHGLSVNQGIWDMFGEYFFTCSDDGTASLWSKDGKRVNSFLGHVNNVQSMALDNRNLMLLTGGTDCSVFLWDIRRFSPINHFDHVHQEAVTSLSFSEDSSVFLTASYDGKVHLWDCMSLNSLKTSSFNRNIPIAKANFIGSYVYCSCLDSKILLWDAREVKSVPIKTYSGHLNDNFSCDSAADKSGLLISGSEEGSVYLWDLYSEELKGKFQIFKKNRVVNALAYQRGLTAFSSFDPGDVSSVDSILISRLG